MLAGLGGALLMSPTADADKVGGCSAAAMRQTAAAPGVDNHSERLCAGRVPATPRESVPRGRERSKESAPSRHATALFWPLRRVDDACACTRSATHGPRARLRGGSHPKADGRRPWRATCRSRNTCGAAALYRFATPVRCVDGCQRHLSAYLCISLLFTLSK